MRFDRFCLLAGLAPFAATAAFADGSSPTPAPVSLKATTYTQDFDTLAATGAGTFTTLPAGWQIFEGGTGGAADGAYITGAGTNTAGGAYSFGSTGSTDRALGSLGSNGVTPIRYGAFFSNDLGATITGLTLAYRGEQWRNGSSTTDSLTFEYSLNATAAGGIGSTTATWVAVSALDFFAPNQTATTAGTALDGNAIGNFTSLSATLAGLTIANGSTFAIRWTDVDSTGGDDGLSVDNFALTALTATGAVPETATWATMTLGFGLLGAALRRRRVPAFV